MIKLWTGCIICNYIKHENVKKKGIHTYITFYRKKYLLIKTIFYKDSLIPHLKYPLLNIKLTIMPLDKSKWNGGIEKQDWKKTCKINGPLVDYAEGKKMMDYR